MMRSFAVLALYGLALNVYANDEAADVDASDDAEAPAAADSKVVVLTDADFDEKVGGGENGRWFVEFYAPWCGHCKALVPKWEELAERLAGSGVHVAKVDATVEKKLAADFRIQGFPTINLIADGKLYDFKGSREVDAMAEFATDGYTDAPAGKLPKDKTTVDEFLKEVENYYQDALKVHGYMPTLLPMSLIFGFFGAVFIWKMFLGGGPKLDVFFDVQVKRDEKCVGGFAMTPSTMCIEKINEDRADLKDMQLGDKVLAVDGNRVRSANDYVKFAHGKAEFKLSLGRCSKLAAPVHAKSE